MWQVKLESNPLTSHFWGWGWEDTSIWRKVMQLSFFLPSCTTGRHHVLFWTKGHLIFSTAFKGEKKDNYWALRLFQQQQKKDSYFWWGENGCIPLKKLNWRSNRRRSCDGVAPKRSLQNLPWILLHFLNHWMIFRVSQQCGAMKRFCVIY